VVTGSTSAFGLEGPGPAWASGSAIAASPAFQLALRRHERRLERDRAYLERAPAVLHGAWGEAPSVGDVLARLDIPQLQRRARGDADPDERLAAERVLYAVYIQSALNLPRTFNERGEHRRALFYLQVAAAIDPEVPHVPHRQAVSWALLGNRREALRALERAVELGWSDAEETAAEPAFADLATEARFQALLAQMRRARPAGHRRRRGPRVLPAGWEHGGRGHALQKSAATSLLPVERRRRRDGAR
jgi:tetratricopeptide (TPR) repeat protein